MSVFFTSDHHLGHERILELGAGRPFPNISVHNNMIRQNWWETVFPEDTVYVMGDIAMGVDFEKNVNIFKALPGRKLLVPGNHDRIFSGANNASRIERFWSVYEDAGFEILPENTSTVLETAYGLQEVLVSHFPYSGDSHSVVDRYASHRFVDEGLPIVHGHTHSRNVLNESNPLEFHVGVDAHDYKPVHESVVVEWLEGLKAQSII